MSGYAGIASAAPPESQKQSPSAAGKKASATTLNFEEEDVGGKRRDPLGSIANRGQADVSTNLIQLRTDWDDEIAESMNYIGGALPSLELP